VSQGSNKGQRLVTIDYPVVKGQGYG
jgi:hypothetical protein